MTIRPLQRVIRALPASDGAGVKLRRSLGQSQFQRVDPFLMLDEFSSDDPDDYLAGFPAHPHRGFETVTYMLVGNMLHEDHLGHRGELKGGGAQWMTAGRGIIHSEMPQQQSGRMHGFQLWINLPAAEKMKPAAYRDLPPNEIPDVTLADGTRVRVIAGVLSQGETQLSGPIQGISTQPLFFDVRLPAGGSFSHGLAATHSAFVYPFEGQVRVGDEHATPLQSGDAGVLGEGEQLVLHAAAGPARFLLLAAAPLNEPIAQYGPFVMNTREEIEQAIADYNTGTLTGPSLGAQGARS